MNPNFDDLPWHDANLQNICVDRKRPGERDVIRISIIWPNEDFPAIVEFLDCYLFKATMNFGIIAYESILTAECYYKSDELNIIRKKWSKVGVDLSELKCFQIRTNSTDSIIDIFALNFRILSE